MMTEHELRARLARFVAEFPEVDAIHLHDAQLQISAAAAKLRKAIDELELELQSRRTPTVPMFARSIEALRELSSFYEAAAAEQRRALDGALLAQELAGEISGRLALWRTSRTPAASMN